MFFDPTYLLFLIMALGVAGVAHWWVGVVIRETSQIATRSGASGSATGRLARSLRSSLLSSAKAAT